MDNLKYYNDSLAYDFEMFAAKPKKKETPKDNIVSMPKAATSKNRKAKAKANTMSSAAFAIMISVFLLVGFCSSIALRLELNEVNAEIHDVKTVIKENNSVKAELEMQMSNRISYANLELEAVKLGMKKPTKENVTYIRVNDKNAAVNSKGEFMRATE